LTPRWTPELRFSLDYTRIAKKDNIANFRTFQEVMDNEALFPQLVIRDPPAAGETVGKVTGLSLASINLARAEVEAFDAQVDYRLDLSRFGIFDLFAVGTYQTHYKTQAGPVSPEIENVGYTSASPLKLKGNLGVNWSRGPWSAGWVARYFDSYYVINPAVASSTNAQSIINQGNGGYISSQKYHDVFAAYHFAEGTGFMPSMFKSAEIKLGIQNVFNTEPPVDTRTVGYSVYGDPRLASYYVSVKAAF
jgi:iron complex outermembrane receptor protein